MSEKTGVIDQFYTSINSTMTPKKGDKGDDVDPGLSSEEDENASDDTEQDELVGQINSKSTVKKRKNRILEEGGVQEN